MPQLNSDTTASSVNCAAQLFHSGNISIIGDGEEASRGACGIHRANLNGIQPTAALGSGHMVGNQFVCHHAPVFAGRTLMGAHGGHHHPVAQLQLPDLDGRK